jgi:Pyridoxamine 5'-phosphate oxidase
MAKAVRELSRHAQAFIARQTIFFVATAAPGGRVNLSPKGLDTLRVLAPDRIVWLGLSGSGNETAAHLLESDRMTLMFCAFEGTPGILRVYGHARVVHPRDADWAERGSLFPALAGARQIFDLAIDRITVSCGTGIPVLAFQRERGATELLPFFETMDEAELLAYWAKKNRTSIDGKPTGIFET